MNYKELLNVDFKTAEDVQDYWNKVSEVPKLTKEVEAELSAALKEGDAEAKNQFKVYLLPFVRSLIVRMLSQNKDISKETMLCEMVIRDTFDAVDTFDFASTNRLYKEFEHNLNWTIRNCITRFIAAQGSDDERISVKEMDGQLRAVRTLKRKLEEEYTVENGYGLAERLCKAGIKELSDEHRKIISYLQLVCDDFSFDHYYLPVILINDSYKTVIERFNRYKDYTGQKESSLDSLSIPERQIDECQTYLKNLGFDQEQVKTIISAIFRLGHAAKNIEEMEKTMKAFSLFDISEKEWNYFICENADLAFNDYSRNLDQTFGKMIDEYGKKESFKLLVRHPELMRVGLDACEDQILQDKLDSEPLDSEDNLEEKMNARDFLEQVFEKMSSRDRELICYKFGFDDGEGKTLEETAEHFGITKERARQIEGKFLRYFRKPINEK